MSDDQIHRVAPSIFADAPHESRSQRYAYIPTAAVLAELRKEGFQPFMVTQTRVRDEGKGDADALGKGDLYTARLTLDITPAMRARIKVSAFTQGVTVADLLRGLLEREFPENHRENTP